LLKDFLCVGNTNFRIRPAGVVNAQGAAERAGSSIARSQNVCPGSNVGAGVEHLFHSQPQRGQIFAINLCQPHINTFATADSRHRSGHGHSFGRKGH
jgi:hypothetical protein